MSILALDRVADPDVEAELPGPVLRARRVARRRRLRHGLRVEVVARHGVLVALDLRVVHGERRADLLVVDHVLLLDELGLLLVWLLDDALGLGLVGVVGPGVGVGRGGVELDPVDEGRSVGEEVAGLLARDAAELAKRHPE